MSFLHFLGWACASSVLLSTVSCQSSLWSIYIASDRYTHHFWWIYMHALYKQLLPDHWRHTISSVIVLHCQCRAYLKPAINCVSWFWSLVEFLSPFRIELRRHWEQYTSGWYATVPFAASSFNVKVGAIWCLADQESLSCESLSIWSFCQAITGEMVSTDHVLIRQRLSNITEV